LQNKKEYMADVAMSLGGFAAEKLVFGDTTTGPSNDLQVVTGLARAMVTRWGMSEKVGPMALESNDGRVVIGDVIEEQRPDESTARVIGVEVKKIIDEGLATAMDILTKHRPLLDIIAKKLIEVETLEQPEYEAIISAHGIPLKKLEA
jgi:cell division protease FtsH